jgi:hypothetical protein
LRARRSLGDSAQTAAQRAHAAARRASGRGSAARRRGAAPFAENRLRVWMGCSAGRFARPLRSRTDCTGTRARWCHGPRRAQRGIRAARRHPCAAQHLARQVELARPVSHAAHAVELTRLFSRTRLGDVSGRGGGVRRKGRGWGRPRAGRRLQQTRNQRPSAGRKARPWRGAPHWRAARARTCAPCAQPRAPPQVEYAAVDHGMCLRAVERVCGSLRRLCRRGSVLGRTLGCEAGRGEARAGPKREFVAAPAPALRAPSAAVARAAV